MLSVAVDMINEICGTFQKEGQRVGWGDGMNNDISYIFWSCDLQKGKLREHLEVLQAGR